MRAPPEASATASTMACRLCRGPDRVPLFSSIVRPQARDATRGGRRADPEKVLGLASCDPTCERRRRPLHEARAPPPSARCARPPFETLVAPPSAARPVAHAQFETLVTPPSAARPRSFPYPTRGIGSTPSMSTSSVPCSATRRSSASVRWSGPTRSPGRARSPVASRVLFIPTRSSRHETHCGAAGARRAWRRRPSQARS